MKRVLLVFLLQIVTVQLVISQQSKLVRELYLLEVYHYQNDTQGEQIHNYLEKAFLPALHRLKYKSVGVFSALGNDTLADKRIYVLIPFSGFDQLMNLSGKIQNDPDYKIAGSAFINAAHDHPAYSRIEKILLQAFPMAATMSLPELKGPRSERVYELRSYESATEKLYRNKVEMFNEGGEIALFKRLGFNAVFYADVIAGDRMPNLMYMTTFNSMASRDEHWKQFSDAPEWKKLLAMPYYQHNVSRADIIFLQPTAYSDY